ncbi:MAG: serine/threonine-protein kinase [Dehalococcoidales bacterium]|jgi:serine/threonine-protein kinase
METINLQRAWQIGNPIASGGFGKVYEAKADDGSPAVIKLVPKSPGASRELLFEELSGLPNIMPVLDTGEWKEYYVIVMPRAEKSLRQHLQTSGGKLGFDETIIVLTDVAQGLASLNAGVVHRDLKPENVLFYNRHWCLTDFGISRYAEATTAPDTHKFSMTPPYAAPEQWRGERATHATDVYAFGVMAFELLQGRLPFPGPDFRDQHLHQAPPVINGVPPSFASLANECLFKAQAARPTPANILIRLQATRKPALPGAGKLQAVNKAVVEKENAHQAMVSAQQSREAARRELFNAAEQSFGVIRESLKQRVLESAPATTVSETRGLNMKLGDGALIVDPVQAAPADCLKAYDYAPIFDVIAYTAITARKPRDHYDYEGRAHSLWYCDAHDEGIYRWYELAFMVGVFHGERGILNPFAMPPNEGAAGAFTSVMGTARQIAWQPVPFNQGNEEQFFERWLACFAGAVDGSISMPSHMPEQSGGRYRQARRRS